MPERGWKIDLMRRVTFGQVRLGLAMRPCTKNSEKNAPLKPSKNGKYVVVTSDWLKKLHLHQIPYLSMRVNVSISVCVCVWVSVCTTINKEWERRGEREREKGGEREKGRERTSRPKARDGHQYPCPALVFYDGGCCVSSSVLEAVDFENASASASTYFFKKFCRFCFHEIQKL